MRVWQWRAGAIVDHSPSNGIAFRLCWSWGSGGNCDQKQEKQRSEGAGHDRSGRAILRLNSCKETTNATIWFGLTVRFELPGRYWGLPGLMCPPSLR